MNAALGTVLGGVVGLTFGAILGATGPGVALVLLLLLALPLLLARWLAGGVVALAQALWRRITGTRPAPRAPDDDPPVSAQRGPRPAVLAFAIAAAAGYQLVPGPRARAMTTPTRTPQDRP